MPYPSDLTDEEWLIVKVLLAQPLRGHRSRGADHRALLNGILWVDTTGKPWSYIPTDLPPWRQVYMTAKRWTANGRLQRIAAVLGRGPKTMPHPPTLATRRKSVQRRSPTSSKADVPVYSEEELEERVAAVKAKRGKP